MLPTLEGGSTFASAHPRYYSVPCLLLACLGYLSGTLYLVRLSPLASPKLPSSANPHLKLGHISSTFSTHVRPRHLLPQGYHGKSWPQILRKGHACVLCILLKDKRNSTLLKGPTVAEYPSQFTLKSPWPLPTPKLVTLLCIHQHKYDGGKAARSMSDQSVSTRLAAVMSLQSNLM
jgi:hypothetical protein